jgi:hypothetical protein
MSSNQVSHDVYVHIVQSTPSVEPVPRTCQKAVESDQPEAGQPVLIYVDTALAST